MIGSFIAARIVRRAGIDGVIGIGAGAATIGGIGIMLSVAIGFSSSLSIVLPMSVYLAGLGMVLPQSIAGALTPFPERAVLLRRCLVSFSRHWPRPAVPVSAGCSEKTPGPWLARSHSWEFRLC
jgi:hypothetical protein